MDSQHTRRISFDVVILDDIEKDSIQPVQVFQHVTIQDLLEDAVKHFDDLTEDSVYYVVVDAQNPRESLDIRETMEALAERGVSRLVIRPSSAIPQKIPCLVLQGEGDKMYPLRKGKTTIGRKLKEPEDGDIDISWDITVSRNSAVITNLDNQITIQHSAANFMINDEKFDKYKDIPLDEEDEIVFGTTRFKLMMVFEDTI